MNRRLLLGAGLAIAVMSTQTAQATASLLACKPEPDPEPQPDASLKAYADELTNLTIKQVNELAVRFKEIEAGIGHLISSPVVEIRSNQLPTRINRAREFKGVLTEADNQALAKAQAKRERKATNRK